MKLHSQALIRLLPVGLSLVLSSFTRDVICCAAEPLELPRYKLQLGQQLVYRTVDPPRRWVNSRGTYDSSLDFSEWTLVVLRRNGDGGWRLVFTQGVGGTYVRSGETRREEFFKDGYFDLKSDGSLVENQTIRHEADPTVLFPPLPPDQASLKAGWESKLALNETRRRMSTPQSTILLAGRDCRFVESPSGALDGLYEVQRQREYEFDFQRGLIRKATTTSQFKDNSKRVDTIELASSRQLDPDELASLAGDCDRYFAVCHEYQKLFDLAETDFRNTAELLKQGESVLEASSEQLKQPMVRKMLDKKRERHQTDSRFALETAEACAKLLDQPSGTWNTVDLQGNAHASTDYRGKVLVLDFWYRSCPACMQAIPHVKRLVEQFAGQPVAILGVNNDPNDSDAQFVVDKLEIHYPTLKNQHQGRRIDELYNVTAWPTLIVVDRQGVIRHIRVGDSPDLAQELAKTIRELLSIVSPAN